MNADVCIIGAGPAGMTAAVFAAGQGAKTILIEKKSSAGSKLLRTARGRCNITHNGSINDFVKAFSTSGRFLKHALYEFSPKGLIDFFAKLNVKIITAPSGCCYPLSNKASDIKQALEKTIKASGCIILFGRTASSVTKENSSFYIRTQKQNISAKTVIITTGGLSYPNTGSTGDGYRFAQSLGHTLIKQRPALIRLVTAQKFPADIQASAVHIVTITAKLSNNRKISTAGPLIFTGDGIGGPAVFDLSRLITDFLPSDTPIPITIDLCPEKNYSQLDKFLTASALQYPRKNIPALMNDFLCAKIARQICRISAIQDKLKAANLSRKQRMILSDNIKALRMDILRTGPIEKALVTKGGIALDQIDPKNMHSKKQQGLFFAGEVIDVDGPCGGYNLQSAFSTGALAGTSAAKFALLVKN